MRVTALFVSSGRPALMLPPGKITTMVRSAREEYFGGIEYELNRERAATLGRYGRRVEVAIARCQALLEDLDESDLAAVEAYKAGRRVALRAIDDLCLQREMLRLYDTAAVREIYRVPPPVGDRRKPSIESRGSPPSSP